MTFKKLAEYFLSIENTASRNEMTEILAKLFNEIHVDEFDKVLYLLQGRLAPQYIKIDFGLGEKLVVRAAAEALQLDKKLFHKKFQEEGDAGRAVEFFKKTIVSMHERDMTITEVFNKLEELATSAGGGSQDRKLSILAELIQTLDGLSARYVVRIPTNTLRLGFSDMTILDAFSWMLKGDKSLRPAIEAAYLVRPDLGHIGVMLKKNGEKGVSHITPTVFTPILMMRAQRVGIVDDIFDKIKDGVIEPKYDGFRLQIHKKGEKVVLYSRGLEDVTYMYPDIVGGIQNEITADAAIIEGEAIGFDPYTGNFLPFQETVQRKRKYNIDEKALEIPLKMFVFELLHCDGKSLLKDPLHDRLKKLRSITKLTGDIFKDTLILSQQDLLKDKEHLELTFDDALSRGLEGIMIKKGDGYYQPGARGYNWIKYKRSQSTKIDDTIDCVVMGYDKGKGKRTGFGIGAFLVGIYDKDKDMFVTVAKIGTGLSDDEWREMHRRCNNIDVSHKPALYDADSLMNVDVWVQPEIVVEIKADEITRSPTHTAGRVLKESKSGKAMDVDEPGYALRFPRLTRFRDDKKPEDATSLEEIREMYSHEKSIKSSV